MFRIDRFVLFPFLRWLPDVRFRSLRRDLLAGLTGAILAVPQSVAYALIAGLPAEYGLYACVVPVIISCLWGSSSYLIGGPTAAVAIVIFASVSALAVPGSDDFIGKVLLLTFLAGIFQWLTGLLRLGSLADFVSHSVILGFTQGAALVIVIGQLPNLLGLTMPARSTALDGLLMLFRHLVDIDVPALLVALFTLAVSLSLRWLWPRSPALLIGLVAASLLVYVWPALFAGVALIQTPEGQLPPFAVLAFDLSDMQQLVPAAVACGMLGLVTSLSIGRSLASHGEQPFDANQEARAQGLANMLGPWFAASLSSGSFTRSALNRQSGAATPLAGVVSAIVLALVALFGSRWVGHIPLPGIAASILLICWGLLDIDASYRLFRFSRSEFVVMLLTLSATLLLEIQTAIYAGVLASLFFYLKRTSRPRLQFRHEGRNEVLYLEGSIFFGACHYLQRVLQRCRGPRVIIDALHVNFIDYAGVQMLHEQARLLAARRQTLVLRHARSAVREEILRLEGAECCPIQFES